jgi:23S rRNA (cytosine1962-C5)-methyltransferase
LRHGSSATLGEKGLEKIQSRHPWLFRGDFEWLPPGLENGALIPVGGRKGEILGWGMYSPGASLCVRLLSWGSDRPEIRSLLEKRVREAEASRSPFLEEGEDAYRWVHGEADGLPGLVIDRYGPVVVVQTQCAGMYRALAGLIEILPQHPGVEAVILRNEGRYLESEGIPREKKLLYGKMPDRDAVSVRTGDARSFVDPFGGQKTGLYLDVRKFPREIRPLCEGARVLDAFAYAGNFSVHALLWGAREVLALDQSREALALASANIKLNGLEGKGQVELEECNVFDRLKTLNMQNRVFDVAVVDPPPFAPSRKQVEGARRGYKELAVRVLRMLAPGGSLLFFSCSQAFGRGALLETLAAAARDVRKTCRITAELHQPPDHPVGLGFPESDYLKGFRMEVRS